MKGVDWRHLLAAPLMALFTCLHGWAQVEWSVDTAKIQWGEPMTLSVNWTMTMAQLKSGMADSTAWPAWTDTTTGGFEILSDLPLDTLPAPNGINADVMLRKEWVLTSWDSGFVVLPPAFFGPYETPPILIEVLTPSLTDDTPPAPPAELFGVHWTWWERFIRGWRWWTAGIALMALGTLIWMGWLKWRANDGNSTSLETKEVSEEPPHVVALRILEGLLREEKWTQGQAKEVQAEASLAIRHYLEGRFRLPAAERTTSEIAALLPASSIPRAWHDRLLQALEQADVVKFAKGNLANLTHRALLETYISFVNETQPNVEQDVE